ncbi:MAG: hypothetical protein ACKVP7_04320 [Hyphomicrobiaceae bacterium]
MSQGSYGLTSVRAPFGMTRASPLLRELVLDHGPIDILGRFFLRAVASAAEHGIELSFGNAGDLVRANKANHVNWLPLVPTLSADYNELNHANFFCVLGRNSSGDVVAAHAARVLQWPETDFIDELLSLRLFYQDPLKQQQPGERCHVEAAEDARALRGLVVYSGAAWVHPDYRRRDLSSVLPRIAKAYALSRWRPDFIASLMTETVHRQGFAPRFGYDHVAWAVHWENSLLARKLRLAIVWMDMAHLVADLEAYLDRAAAQIDAVIDKRRAQ